MRTIQGLSEKQLVRSKLSSTIYSSLPRAVVDQQYRSKSSGVGVPRTSSGLPGDRLLRLFFCSARAPTSSAHTGTSRSGNSLLGASTSWHKSPAAAVGFREEAALQEDMLLRVRVPGPG